MLICLGGFLGSGRRSLAKNIAKRLGFHYYDIDQKKAHIPMAPGDRKDGAVWKPTPMPRMFIYRRTLEDFPRLSKMYPNVVIDTGFPREKSRQFFFSEARKYFDKVLFVWVGLDDDSVEKKFSKKGEKYAAEAIQKREFIKKEFQELSLSTPVFLYTGTELTDGTFDDFYDFISKELK